MTIKPAEIRAVVLAILLAIGIGLTIAPGASAAPANGAVLRDAAMTTSDLLEVRRCVVRRWCRWGRCRAGVGELRSGGGRSWPPPFAASGFP
jgi:hypothetical protein